MLTISRSILRRFRTLCRRGGIHKAGSAGCVVTFVGGPDGCRVRAASLDVAIEYHQPEPCDSGTILLPLAALESCEGRDDELVTFTVRPDDSVELAWNDRGVPRRSEQSQPPCKSDSFPSLPTEMLANDTELWPALADAVATTDPNSSRYALGCLHLRGTEGKVEATDGHQVLIQSGYRFGFEGDVLISASTLLGHTDLKGTDPFRVGRNEHWTGFVLGPWALLLKIQKDARFPKIDQILPNHEAAKSRLTMSAADARFLAETLPRLPSDDELHSPVTLDLNGRVLVRARESQKGRPTEVELGSSSLAGVPVTFCSDRRYVERALRLGFRDVLVYGPESPVLCRDDRRRYLWALLGKESIVPRCDDPVRIEAPRGPARPRASNPQPSEAPVTVPINNKIVASTTAATPSDAKTVKRARTQPAASTTEQAVALRDTLRSIARQAGELARSLKQQRRQARIVATTLASLKELQKVAG